MTDDRSRKASEQPSASTSFIGRIKFIASILAAIAALVGSAEALVTGGVGLKRVIGGVWTNEPPPTPPTPDYLTVPPYAPPRSCVALPGRAALTGSELEGVLQSARKGEPPSDWQALIAGCEKSLDEVASALNMGGLAAHRANDFWRSTRLWKMALNVDPSKLAARFNLVCSYARLAKHENAIIQLRQLRNAGPLANEWLVRAKKDSDLVGLRAHRDFATLTRPL